ncbi:nucleolar protein dao-5-like [Oryza brachyantha]|uniref:Glabrous enhancer-binding protein-like DBD domain-containing protein n=1 Tax=Oryza brachyantha TaxID=4533 RepID=J3LC92_ORYBR|nr:nucleolar protein dao-5-like [Oryza brachyantha]
MARKRRAPTPPPPEAKPSDQSSGEEEEEEGESPAAMAPQKLGGAPHQVEEEEGGGSSESEPMRKVAAKKARSEASAYKKKRAASPEPAPSGKAKKAKAEKAAAPEPAPSGKAKKAKAEKTAAPEPAPSGKGKKAKAEKAAAPESTLSGMSKKAAKAEAGKAAAADTETAPSGKAKKSKSKVEPGNAALDPSSSSKPRKAATRWARADEIKILEILVAHFKNHGTQLSTDGIIGAAGDNLDRKNIKHRNMYKKVGRLKQRYEATAKKFETSGNLPYKEDDLRMYQLSSEIWGKDAKEAVSVLASQNNGIPAKSKKGQGQAKKDKVDGDSKEDTTAVNEKGGTLAENKKGKATKQKTGAEAKIGSSKEATTNSKGGENHTEGEANETNKRRKFIELQSLYPNLAFFVKEMEVQHQSGSFFKRSFELISDDKACTLETKIKNHRKVQVETQLRRDNIRKEVFNAFLGLF